MHTLGGVGRAGVTNVDVVKEIELDAFGIKIEREPEGYIAL
jgi:hypothetical protein